MAAVMIIAQEPRRPVQAASFTALPRHASPSPVTAADPMPEPTKARADTVVPEPPMPVTAEVTRVNFREAAAGTIFVAKADAPSGHVSTIRSTPQAAPAPQGAKQVFEVTGSRVNLRAGPSTGHDVLAALTRGTRARITGTAGNDWVELEVQATGQRGFMAQRFLAPVS